MSETNRLQWRVHDMGAPWCGNTMVGTLTTASKGGSYMKPLKLGEYPDGKTNYQIIDEFDEKTTITLDKWVADILQLRLPDVHSKIQGAYTKSLQTHPDLSRRERGNLIRMRAEHTANGYQDTKKHVLGWNDDELL